MVEIHEGKTISKTIWLIAHDLHLVLTSYEGYKISGCCYNTKSRDMNQTIQNSGVMLTSTTMQVFSTKDKYLVVDDGVIPEIWEVSWHLRF